MQFDNKIKNAEKTILTEMAYGFSTNSKKVTQAELLAVLREISDPDVKIKFTSITDATYKKKNPLGTIFKVSQTEGVMNADYAARKQEQLNQEAPGTVYTPGKSSFGTHETSTIVTHVNNKYYLQVVPEKSQSPRFVIKDTIGRFSEKTKVDVQPYIKLSTPSTGNEVILRRYQLSSIAAFEVNNESYEITDVDADRKAILDIVNFGTPE